MIQLGGFAVQDFAVLPLPEGYRIRYGWTDASLKIMVKRSQDEKVDKGRSLLVLVIVLA